MVFNQIVNLQLKSKYQSTDFPRNPTGKRQTRNGNKKRMNESIKKLTWQKEGKISIAIKNIILNNYDSQYFRPLHLYKAIMQT